MGRREGYHHAPKQDKPDKNQKPRELSFSGDVRMVPDPLSEQREVDSYLQDHIRGGRREDRNNYRE